MPIMSINIVIIFRCLLPILRHAGLHAVISRRCRLLMPFVLLRLRLRYAAAAIRH